MNKEEHIQHWLASAEESWESALYLAKGKHFSLSLLALHLSLEKMFKAIWIQKSVKDNPPYIHDLQKLADMVNLEISADDYDYLAIMNSWNIRGRYPDYTKRLYQSTTVNYLNEQIEKSGKIKKWLQEKILNQK